MNTKESELFERLLEVCTGCDYRRTLRDVKDIPEEIRVRLEKKSKE